MSLATTFYPTDANLVISTASTTMILASDEELEEVTNKYCVSTDNAASRFIPPSGLTSWQMQRRYSQEASSMRAR